MTDFDPVRVLEVLHRHQVDFVLVGGLAAVAHGSSLTTVDIDIAPSRRRANLQRLAQGLQELDARIRVAQDRTGSWLADDDLHRERRAGQPMSAPSKSASV